MKLKGNFDLMNERKLTIMLPEINVMFKDYEILPRLIQKDEVGELVKGINLESIKNDPSAAGIGDLQSMNI